MILKCQGEGHMLPNDISWDSEKNEFTSVEEIFKCEHSRLFATII